MNTSKRINSNRIKRNLLCVFAVVALTVSCSENNFDSNGAQPGAAEIPTVIGTPIGTPITPIGTACVQGISQVQLLSQNLGGIPSSINQGMFRPQRTIQYLIGLQCAGQQVPLNNVQIAFDVNATVTPFSTPIGYRILDPQTGAPFSSNLILDSVPNRDLFGNVGPTWAHWVTNTLSINRSQLEVIFEVVITDRDIGFAQTPDAPQGYINSFISVAGTQPVVRPIGLVNGF